MRGGGIAEARARDLASLRVAKPPKAAFCSKLVREKDSA
jgi:hypothetical protein